MTTSFRFISFLCAVAGLLCGGCASPNFRPVTTIPPGRALVYIYAPKECVPEPTMICHNGGKLGSLGRDEYYVHFPEPGTNAYTFHLSFSDRGGLVGLLVKHQDPGATVVRIEEGKTYYLKLIGARAGASLWREEESAALPDLQKCHSVEVEKPKRLSDKTP